MIRRVFRVGEYAIAVIISMVAFLFLQSVWTRFNPGWELVPPGLGVLFIVVILLSYLAVSLMRKGLDIDKDTAFAIGIVVFIVLAIMLFFPGVFGEDAVFTFAIMDLQSVVGLL